MTAPPPDRLVSVVIPHYNDLGGLLTCMAALRQQSYRGLVEVVIADNNSAGGLDSVAHAVGADARVVPAPVQGAGPARNAGTAASRGQVLAFLDSDCVPHPDWLNEGLLALQRFDFVGGCVETFAADPARPNPVEAFEMVFNFNFRRYIEKVGFTGTGNMLVRREVLNQVGGFRTGVSEDMEWSFRARAHGFRLGYAERAVVGHPARASWATLKRRWSRIVDEHFALACERRGGALLFALKAGAMPLSVIPHTGKILLSRKLPTIAAKLGAIGVLLRLRAWRTARMLRLAIPALFSKGRDISGSGLPGSALDMQAPR